jgi:hypothetical protein
MRTAFEMQMDLHARKRSRDKKEEEGSENEEFMTERKEPV